MQRSGEDAQEQDESNGQRSSSRRKRFSFAGYPSSSAQSGKTSSKRTNVLRKKHDRSENLTGSQQDIAIAAAAGDSAPYAQKASDRTSVTQGIAVKAKNLAIVHPMSAQPAPQSSNAVSKKKSGSSGKASQQNSNAKLDMDETQQQKSAAYALRNSHSQPNLAHLDRKLNRSTSSKDSRTAANVSMTESNKPQMSVQDGAPNRVNVTTANAQMSANFDSSSFVRSNTNVNLAKSASSVTPFAPTDMTFGAESQWPKTPYPHPNANFAMHQNSNVQRPGGLQKAPTATAVASFTPFQNTANGYPNAARGAPYQASFAPPNDAYPYPARPVPPPGTQRHSLNIAASPTQLGNVARASNNQPQAYAPPQSLSQTDKGAKPTNSSNRNSLQFQVAYPSTETVPSSSSSINLSQGQGQYEPDTQPYSAPDTFNTPRTANAPGRIPLSGDGTIVRNSYAALLRRQSQRIVSGAPQQDSQALKQRFMATLSEAAANSTNTNVNMNLLQTTNASLLGAARSMSTQSFMSDDGAIQSQQSTFGSHSQLDSVQPPVAVAVAEWRQPRAASGVRLLSDSQLPSDEQHQQEQQILRVVETRRSYSRRKVADRSTAFLVGTVEPLDELEDDQHQHQPPRDFNAARRPSLPIELSGSFASSVSIAIDHEPSSPTVAPVPPSSVSAQFEVRAVRKMLDQQPNASRSVHTKSASLDRTVPYFIPTASVSTVATIGVGVGNDNDNDHVSEPSDFQNTRLSLATQPVIAPTSWKAKTFTAAPKPYQLNPVVSSVSVLRNAPNELQYSNDLIEEPVQVINSSSQRLNQARTEPPLSSRSFSESEPPILLASTTRNPQSQLPPPPIPPKPKTSQSTNMISNPPSFEQTSQMMVTPASIVLPKHVQFAHQARSDADNQPKVKDDPFVLPPRRGRPAYKETNIDESPGPPEINRAVAITNEPRKPFAVAAQIVTVPGNDERRTRPPPKVLTDANANRPTVSTPNSEIRITLNDEPVPISIASVNALRSNQNSTSLTNSNASLKIDSLVDSATQANTAANSGSFVQPGSRGGPALLASLAALSGRQRSPEETEYERAANAFASTSGVSDTYWQSLLTAIAPNLKSSTAAQSGAVGGFDENEEYYDESEIDNGLEDENSSGRSPSRSHSTKSASDYLDEVFGASPHQSSGTSIGVTSEPFTEHQRSLFNRYNSIRRKLHKAPSTNDDSTEQASPTRSSFAAPGSTGSSSWATVTDPERWREETAARLTTMMALAKRKTEYLRASETDVELDMRANDELGRQIRAVLVRKCAVRAEIDKYDAHVNELDKIIKLLLQLSVRLAKTEQQVRETTDGVQKKAMVEKRNRLRIQYEDAKQLKAAMDKRSVAVHQTLTELFTPEEFDEYRLYVEMKAKLVVEHQELQDCLHTADEQLAALRNAQTALSALTAAQIRSLPSSSSASQHSG